MRAIVLVAVVPFCMAAPALWAADPPPAEGPDPNAHCTMPGEQVVEDGASDSTDHVPGHEITGIFVAEPGDVEDTVEITLKRSGGTATPSSSYFVGFTLDDGKQYFVTLDSSGKFSYGHIDDTGAETSDGAAGDKSASASDGSITWVLPRSAIESLKGATKMTDIAGESRFSGMKPDTTDKGTYELRGNASCPKPEGKSSGFLMGGALSPLALLMLGFGVLARRRG